MLEDVLKWLARKEPGANQIRPVELISGVRVWEFDCEPPQNCVVAGLSVGHHETVFCQEGGVKLEGEGGEVLLLGEGQVLMAVGPSQSRTACFCGRRFRGVLVAAQSAEAWEGLKMICRLLGELTLDTKKVGNLLQAQGNLMVVRGTPWNEAVTSAMWELPAMDWGHYCLLKSLELLYLIQHHSPVLFPNPETAYYDAYQVEQVRQVRDYMLAHMEEPLTIQNLAERFHLSSTALKAAFRQLYGRPVHAYLRDHRLEQAAKLLAETSMTVLQVAISVGYGSLSQFGSAFKEHYHLSPVQYRRAEQKKIQNRQSLPETGGNMGRDMISSTE